MSASALTHKNQYWSYEYAKVPNIPIGNNELQIPMYINRNNYFFNQNLVNKEETEALDNEYVFSFPRKTKYSERLDRIAGLKNNWDGYGAVALSTKVLENARMFLDAVNNKGFDKFLNDEDIVPTPYGTIDIDFESVKGLVSVEIAERMIGFFTEFNGIDDTSSEGIETDFYKIPDVIINNIGNLI